MPVVLAGIVLGRAVEKFRPEIPIKIIWETESAIQVPDMGGRAKSMMKHLGGNIVLLDFCPSHNRHSTI
jgi:hypothetical protein